VTTTIHELFEAQAANTPHATAAVYDACSITFAELNERAHRVATTFM
jgi:non-ribosomal peptide synthetase component F